MAELSDFLDSLFDSEFKIHCFGGNALAPEYLLIGKVDGPEDNVPGTRKSPTAIIGPRDKGDLLNFHYEKDKNSRYKMENFWPVPKQNRIDSFIYDSAQGEEKSTGWNIEAYNYVDSLPKDIGYKEIPMTAIWQSMKSRKCLKPLRRHLD